MLLLLSPAVALLLLPTLVIAAMDVGRERMRLSRTAAVPTIVLLGAAAYLVLIGIAGAVARMVGGDYGELVQGLFLCVALGRSEEHTHALQSLMRILYAVFCLQKQKSNSKFNNNINIIT